MKKEAYIFLHSSDDELYNKDDKYWIFVNGLISTSYDLKDYHTTKYSCEKYLKLHDSEDEDCQEYLSEIKALSEKEKSKSLYSFWKLKVEPETFILE